MRRVTKRAESQVLPTCRARTARQNNPSQMLSLFYLAALASDAEGALHCDRFTNAALASPPILPSTTVDSSEFMLSNFTGSASVSGVLLFDNISAPFFAFDCSFGGGQIAYVWINDHLVCHTDPPFGNAPGSTDGSRSNPLPRPTSNASTILIHISSSSLDGTGAITSGTTASVRVRWAALKRPGELEAPWTSIPSSVLSPATPALEQQRRSLQDNLKQGWQLWSYNLLGIVRLPEASVITTALCQISTSKCLSFTRIEDTKATVRVGPFATDQSYWQFFVAFHGINVSISGSGGAGPLHVLVDPISCTGPATAACGDFELLLLARYQWFRPGDVHSFADGSIRFAPLGLATRQIQPTAQPVRHGGAVEMGMAEDGNERSRAAAHVAFSLSRGPVGLREGGGPSPHLAEVRDVIRAARAAELRRYEAYGVYGEVKEALQSATMWNYIFQPAEYGPMLPVSRSWNFVKHQANSDWSYVIFDWDNFFASYMASLDPRSKNIAYSNFIQVVRSRTARGFIPNYSAGGTKSVDRTEPPIGAKVLLELYGKYKDGWFVQLTFDDLLRWNDWIATARTTGPLGIVSLGSDTVGSYIDSSAATMQGARYESGLDNSPMYDGSFFDPNVSSTGSLAIGQMRLYDVGFASMFVQEAEALASLAPVAGRSDVVPRLKARAARQRRLIQQHLYDADSEAFVNKFWNGSFYHRISPTSFYGLMAGAATDGQATRLVQKYLLSPEHFCISADGDFAGLHDNCYWGLPSIQRKDPAFPPLGYWRGFTWGPMAMLTYWSLARYDHLPIVRRARKALCKQMTAMMLNQWRRHRHVCENYSPHRNAEECSGTKFYHWGALSGMTTLIDAGYY